MAKDITITPGSGTIEFHDLAGAVQITLEVLDDGTLQ
jgi:hypothetical protein